MNRSPDFNLYILPAKDSTEDGPWTRAGAGWTNRDQSINFVVNEPLAAGVRVQVRKVKRDGASKAS